MNQLCLSVNLAYLLLIIVVYFTLFAHCLRNAIPICTIVLGAKYATRVCENKGYRKIGQLQTRQIWGSLVHWLVVSKMAKLRRRGHHPRTDVPGLRLAPLQQPQTSCGCVLRTCVVIPVERTLLGRISLVIAWA